MTPASSLDRLAAALAGRYRIERELGAGGMATVYLAHDLKHGRDVAVKVLRPELGAALGGDRFLSEITTTARLQHPHILPLLDSGEAGGLLYYVMPLVTGETLRARLERERQLPVADAVRIAREVAGALDYAHRQGVIHRDIKPENILLHDGSALVADFGIALAVSQAGGARLTQTGFSLGTPQYMAPEQATGERTIDARADVYALGAVLFEMLAGEPPFSAPTLQAIVAKLMAEGPRRLGTLRRSVPVTVDEAVDRALEKIPADRFLTARDFAEALETRVTDSGRPAPAAQPGRLARLVPWAVALVAVAALASRWLQPPPNVRPGSAARFTIAIPDSLRLMAPQVSASGPGVDISPDGTRLVFVMVPPGGRRTQLYSRVLGDTTLTPMIGTEGAIGPFFSPDNQWLAFLQDGKLKKIPVTGGQATAIADMPEGVTHASWGPGGVILYARAFGALMRIDPVSGASSEILPSDSSGATFYASQVLPDGKTAIVTKAVPQGSGRVLAVSLASGDTATLMENVTSPRYVTDGRAERLVYGRPDGSVMAVTLDPGHRRIVDAPVTIAEGAQVNPGSWISNLAVSLGGTIVFAHASEVPRELVIRERTGPERVLPTGSRTYRTPRFSPNGRDIAVMIQLGANDTKSDIWTFEVDRGALRRLTLDGGSNFPEYSADGRWIVYGSLTTPANRDILRLPAGGGSAPDTLLAAPGQQHEGLLTPDGTELVYREIGGPTRRDIWVAPLAPGKPRRPLAVTDADEFSVALSPDGKLIAYQSQGAAGGSDVYVRPVAGSPDRWQVTSNGGQEPRWGHDGRTLYYRVADSLFSVAVEPSPTFKVGGRSLVLTGNYVTDFRASYDVSPDGRRFVLVRALASARPDQVTVLLNAIPR